MNQEDYIPLFEALLGGDVAAVESFLQTPGIDVDFLFVIRNASGNEITYTPLTRAIRLNHQTIFEVLLAHGAAVNGPVGAFQTPLQMACDEDSVNGDVVNVLLEHGAGVDATTVDDRRTPLTLACRRRTNLGIVQLLINSGADVNGGGGEHAPLQCAAWSGNIEAIELLIQAGADVNRVSTDDYADIIPAGSTPLHWAASEGELGCLTTLLEAGADPNIANAEGQISLHPAACISEIVTALLLLVVTLCTETIKDVLLFDIYMTKVMKTLILSSLLSNSKSSLLWWLLEIVRGSACRPLALVWKQQWCLCGRLLLMSYLSLSSVWMVK